MHKPGYFNNAHTFILTQTIPESPSNPKLIVTGYASAEHVTPDHKAVLPSQGAVVVSPEPSQDH